MQTRNQFFSTGLVPTKHPIQDADECSICLSDCTDSVKLPCGHCFCKDCIEQWLKKKGRNTCPMCKAKLFVLPSDEDPVVPVERREQVANALRALRLGERNAAEIVETYGSNLFTVSQLQRATAHATHYLGQDRQPGAGSTVQEHGSLDRLFASGPAVIRAQHLSANFVAMANLIPAFAAAQGREFLRRQKSDWSLIMRHLWISIRSQDGKKGDALVMAAKLRETVESQLKGCYSDIDYCDFFFRPADPSVAIPCKDDLDLLLSYVTLRCWSIQRDEDNQAAQRREVKAKRHEARKEPKMKSPCGVM